MKPFALPAKRFRAMPLKEKARSFSLASFCVLFIFFICCTAALAYYNFSFKRLFDASYLQSDAMGRMSDLSRAIAAYESAPNTESRQQIESCFQNGWELFNRFPDDPRQQSEELRMLKTAILRTYATYEKSVQELFRLGSYRLHTTDYYLQYYETVEIGDYIDTYLEQMLQENLREGQALYRTQSRILHIAPLILAALLLLSAFVLLHVQRWFSSHLLSPILSLAEAARTLAANQMDIPDVPVCGSDDEIGDLTRTFNRMKDDCRSLLTAQQEKEELTRELYEERLSHIAAENQLSAAQLAMLKQQINPHFLFNTLTLISQTAQQENAGETGRLIQQLSILLRHNLYDRQDRVTIRQELETLYSYMYIQESRFLDRVAFWVDCQVPPEDYCIPTFTLQPLVENAVSHGVAPREAGGVIRIKIALRGALLRITVTDNGVGMDKAVRGRLNRLEDVPAGQNNGIGVVNVARRLDLLCPGSRFHVASWPGLGTCIRIELPLSWAKRQPEGKGDSPS